MKKLLFLFFFCFSALLLSIGLQAKQPEKGYNNKILAITPYQLHRKKVLKFNKVLSSKVNSQALKNDFKLSAKKKGKAKYTVMSFSPFWRI
jgi:hypothetical protein